MNQRLKRLQKIIDAINGSYVVIGVIGGTHTDEEGNAFGMADLAAVHEFGGEHHPERSFLRSSLIENKASHKQMAAVLLKQAINGQLSEGDVYRKLGAIAAGGAQKKILTGTFAPLKKATIRRKRSSKPLIDTGQLLQSITWAVRNGNS